MENSFKLQKTAFVAICIVSAALAIVSCVFYKSTNVINTEPVQQHSELIQTEDEKQQNATQTSKIVKKKIIKPLFPHCIIIDELNDAVLLLVIKKTKCLPDDICQYQNQNKREDAVGNNVNEASDKERGAIVVYIAVVLLLISLIAALLEVYRSKFGNKTLTKIGGKTILSATAPELSRRCSLADLTVLRHNRRESMMRRDSAMHMSVDHATVPPSASVVAGNPRMPLRILGPSKSQDECRRNSLSVKLSAKWQRSVSVDKPEEQIQESHHRIHMIRHH